MNLLQQAQVKQQAGIYAHLNALSHQSPLACANYLGLFVESSIKIPRSPMRVIWSCTTPLANVCITNILHHP